MQPPVGVGFCPDARIKCRWSRHAFSKCHRIALTGNQPDSRTHTDPCPFSRGTGSWK